MYNCHMRRWKFTGDDWDKRREVQGPTTALTILVDYDDVHHPTVDAEVAQLIRILEEHWTPVDRVRSCDDCSATVGLLDEFGLTLCPACHSDYHKELHAASSS